jgi:hypothetical protein
LKERPEARRGARGEEGGGEEGEERGEDVFLVRSLEKKKR